MTQEEARKLFDYNAETGDLLWRIGRNAGSIAGTVSKSGYRMLMVRRGFNKNYYAHRVIWLWVYGEWPTMVDHVNMDKADNRLVNLRLCTMAENLANQKARSSSGFKGVWRRHAGKPWAASIRKGRKTYHLGAYDTPEEANEAYRLAAKTMHGEFARG